MSDQAQPSGVVDGTERVGSEQPNELSRYITGTDIARSIIGIDQLTKNYTQTRNDEESGAESSDSTSNEKATGATPSTGNAGDGAAVATGEGHRGAPAQRVSMFDPSVKQLRIKVAVKFIMVWFIIGCLITASFSLYWGSLYNRQSHLVKVKMLVVIEDDYMTGVNQTIGEAYMDIINTSLKHKGDWTILNGTQEIDEFFGPYTNLTAEIIERVHHREYWTATHVSANATLGLLNYYKGELATKPMQVQYVYESGRDPTGMSTILAVIEELTQLFESTVFPTLLSELLSMLSSEQLLTFMSASTVSVNPYFGELDYRPFYNSILLAPLQVGLIFLLISSFILFNFFGQVHAILLPHVKIPHYMLYRFLGNHISYLVLSLFICTVSAIFQIDFTLAFGRAGFVIFWFSTYLTMAAVGGANDNVCMVIFAHNPPFLGVWLISFVIMNVSPSFSAMALTNNFYRYGYAMPMHQANEIFKVIFLDLWKGNLGRNYGILVVWIVLNTVINPFVLKHVGSVMAKRAAAEARAKAN